MRKIIFAFALTLATGCTTAPVPDDTATQPEPEASHCGSTDEPCCLTPIGAPPGQLLAECTPGLVCTVVAGTGTTMSYCRYVPAGN